MSAARPTHSVALTAAVSAQLLAKLKAILEGINQIQCDVNSIIAVLQLSNASHLEEIPSQEKNVKLESKDFTEKIATLKSAEDEKDMKSAKRKFVTKKLQTAAIKSRSQIPKSSKSIEDPTNGTAEVMSKKSKRANSIIASDKSSLNFSFVSDNVQVLEADEGHPTPLNRVDGNMQPQQEFLESLFAHTSSSSVGLFSSPVLPKEGGSTSAFNTNKRGRKRKAK